MICVLPFWSGDAWLAVKNLKWMQQLDTKLDFDCILSFDTATDPTEVRKVASELFRSVQCCTYKRQQNNSWPFPQNHAFTATAWHMVNLKQPWLWFETDSVPMKAGWLTDIAKAHEEGKKPFTGHWNAEAKVFNGTAVYPANVSRYSSKAMMATMTVGKDGKQSPWDVYCSPQVEPHLNKRNDVFQHLWEYEGAPPTFPNAKSVDAIVRPGISVFHRSKDGTLIDQMRLKLFPPPAPVAKEPPCFVQLGRHGDLILLLPAFKRYAEECGKPVPVYVGKDFADTLKGVSYVNPIVVNCETLEDAAEVARKNYPQVIVTQLNGKRTWPPPDSLSSYSLTMWHRTGLTNEYGSLLPVFDQRRPKEEEKVIKQYVTGTKPVLLVNFEGSSNPFKPPELYSALQRLDEFQFLDMKNIRANRVYDLLGLMDVAVGLVTIDTMTLHLASASKIPYVALVADKGKSASVPKGNCKLTVGYSKTKEAIGQIISEVKSWLPKISKPVQQPRSRKYIIGTGYHSKPGQGAEEFYPIWYANTVRYAQPDKIIVLASGGHAIPGALGQWIPMDGDLGHTHDLSNSRKPYHWCGWSIALVNLALLSYFNECDFIFKEQDVLAFGPWVNQMYDEIGQAGMIVGKAKCMPVVQSLLLCKHWFIPEFVRLYMGTGSEQKKENEGELKFMRLEKQNPQFFARYSFGFDRDRPINYDADVFYGQHWTPDELAELKKRNLI